MFKSFFWHHMNCHIIHVSPFSCRIGKASQTIRGMHQQCRKLNPTFMQGIGHTGRCLNDSLHEHNNNVRNAKEGFLAIHCCYCGCTPMFEETMIIGRHEDQRTREIIEAAQKVHQGSSCISKACKVCLLGKELSFLEEHV